MKKTIQINIEINEDGTTYTSIQMFEHIKEIGMLFFDNGKFKKAFPASAKEYWDAISAVVKGAIE